MVYLHVSTVPVNQRALLRQIHLVSYIDNGFNLAEDGSHGLSDEGNSGEEAGLANEDIEKSLVDADKLCEISSQTWI